MRALLLLVALLASGCVVSRPSHPPGTLAPPTTLAEVNSILASTRATIHYTDGRQPEEVFVFVGVELSLVQLADPDRTAPVLAVPTEQIAFIEIDDSLPRRQGASNGAKLGTFPGGVLMGTGVLLAVTNPPCGEYDISCALGPAAAIVSGAVITAVGALAGAAAGSVLTSQRYPVIVYQAPLSGYPDAASHASSTPQGSIGELATGDRPFTSSTAAAHSAAARR